MSRRIDSLYCTTDTAEDVVRSVIEATRSEAQLVKNEVAAAVSERIQALQARQQELIEQIDCLVQTKLETLTEQLQQIQGGTCPYAPGDAENQPRAGVYLLNADAVLSFRLAETDFAEKIPSWGQVGEKSTYASLSFAKGPGLGVLKVNNPSFLWVFACDREGQRRTEGGDRVVATLSHPEEFQDVSVEDLQDGRYKVTFLPLTPGSYNLQISIGPEGADEELCGCPFTLEVRPPTVYQTIGVDAETEGKAQLGSPGEPHVADCIGSVHHPSGVAFDHTGRYLFIVDQSNHRVQVFDSMTQEVLGAYGSKGLGPSHFDMPCGIVADRENKIIVSDLLNHRLQVLEFNPRTQELSFLQSIGSEGSGPGQFSFPKGLGLTENGGLLVCDSANHRVQVLDMDGFSMIREFGSYGFGDGQFDSPLAATITCTGEILISDGNNRIQVFDGKGGFLRSFGVRGKKDGFFHYPVGIAVNDENALFVCDQGNHRIQVFNASDGSFIHKWGGSKKKKEAPPEGQEVPPDSEGEEPQPDEWQGLRSPAGIAVNASGMIVVTDYHTHAIYAF
mmetsp:Transcript_3944/g.6490  ORF Transcript_3944/g.6490 Transcript_3944/m.6490 type:complete len:561 (-) Transcript_3944:49-1731(-)